nr:hypothetical protein LSAT_9X27740 [Tanacetum cinerariifolium]
MDCGLLSGIPGEEGVWCEESEREWDDKLVVVAASRWPDLFVAVVVIQPAMCEVVMEQCYSINDALSEIWTMVKDQMEQCYSINDALSEIWTMVKDQNTSVFFIVALFTAAAVSAQATTPAPSPDAGATFSVLISGVVIGSSMLLSLVALFKS